jgi:hypothetical protein
MTNEILEYPDDYVVADNSLWEAMTAKGARLAGEKSQALLYEMAQRRHRV